MIDIGLANDSLLDGCKCGNCEYEREPKVDKRQPRQRGRRPNVRIPADSHQTITNIAFLSVPVSTNTATEETQNIRRAG